jgi:predicted permease
MLKDLRHAARALFRDKAWTTVVVLSLALGIGANTALFSAVNGLYLKKLAVHEPDALVRLKWAGRNDMVTDSRDYGFSNRDATGATVRATFSFPMFRQFAASNQTLEDLVACAPYGRVSLVVDGKADLAQAFISTGNYYRLLGLTANLGRTIVPEDDRPDAAPVAVISARFWQSRFGRDPHVVGKVVQFNNVPVTIVGVMSPDLIDSQQAVREGADIAIPLALDAQANIVPRNPDEPIQPRVELPTYWWLQVVGRMKPGVTAAQVQGNLEGVFQQTARAGLDVYLRSLDAKTRSSAKNRSRVDVPSLRVEPAGRGIYDVNTSDSTALTMLSAVVVLILLIVCANVANLLLSRAATRQKELSVRLSLGATRARLVRQMLTESLLLSGVGGVLGILVGRWSQPLLPLSAGVSASLDWRVLGFALTVTVVTGIAFGIAPALRATNMNVSATLKNTSRSVYGSRSLLSKALLVGQVAVSLVLLIGAGLFVRTLKNLYAVDVGFNTRNLVLFTVNPTLNRYDLARTDRVYAALRDRLEAIPGVRSVAYSNVMLLSGSVNQSSYFVQGRSYPAGFRDSTNRLSVSSGFFETLDLPIVAGRGISDRDTRTSAKVIVLNQTAARKYFGEASPIGQRLGTSAENTDEMEVIGVVRDAKYDSVRDEVPPTAYVPFAQWRVVNAVFHVRAAGAAASITGAVRAAVNAVDPNLPVINMSTQEEQVDKRLQPERTFAQAYSLFGGLALLLASIGLFGLMSYSIARRTNEIGIRMALGAQRRDVLRLVMSESMTLVGVGVAIGLAAALAASRLVAALLFGLAPTDGVAIAAATLLLGAVSALAGYLPARRASLVDPLVALHYE